MIRTHWAQRHSLNTSAYTGNWFRVGTVSVLGSGFILNTGCFLVEICTFYVADVGFICHFSSSVEEEGVSEPSGHSCSTKTTIIPFFKLGFKDLRYRIKDTIILNKNKNTDLHSVQLRPAWQGLLRGEGLSEGTSQIMSEQKHWAKSCCSPFSSAASPQWI